MNLTHKAARARTQVKCTVFIGHSEACTVFTGRSPYHAQLLAPCLSYTAERLACAHNK
jgi:hypothetical protein